MVDIQFKQCRNALILNVHTIVGKAYFFGKIIAALVDAVDVQVNRHYVIGCHSTYQAGCLHSDGIGEH